MREGKLLRNVFHFFKKRTLFFNVVSRSKIHDGGRGGMPASIFLKKINTYTQN